MEGKVPGDEVAMVASAIPNEEKRPASCCANLGFEPAALGSKAVTVTLCLGGVWSQHTKAQTGPDQGQILRGK